MEIPAELSFLFRGAPLTKEALEEELIAIWQRGRLIEPTFLLREEDVEWRAVGPMSDLEKALYTVMVNAEAESTQLYNYIKEREYPLKEWRANYLNYRYNLHKFHFIRLLLGTLALFQRGIINNKVKFCRGWIVAVPAICRGPLFLVRMTPPRQTESAFLGLSPRRTINTYLH